MKIDYSSRQGRRIQGQLIQKAAEDAGLSLEGLAREIGCSRALIYQYVSGSTLAQLDRLQQIAACTRKTLSFFLGETGLASSNKDQFAALKVLLDAQMGHPDFRGALATCEKLIALARESGDEPEEATAHLRQANLLLQRGEFGRTLAELDDNARLISSQGSNVAALQMRGHAQLSLGRVEEAEAAFRAVAGMDSWSARWQGLIALAAVSEYRGRYREALQLIDEALILADSAPDTQSAGRLRLYALGNLANIYLACADFTTAMEQARQAMDLAIQHANRDQYVEAILTMGVCLRESGELVESRIMLETALHWTRLIGDEGRECLACAELSRTLVEMGCVDDARLLGKKALHQALSTGAQRAEQVAQMSLAICHLLRRLPRDAHYHATRAWEISLRSGQAYAQAEALCILGDAYLASGEKQAAREAYLPALDLAESIGARLPALRITRGLACAGYQPVDIEASIAIARELPIPGALWPLLLQSGICHEDGGDLRNAELRYREAISIIERIREKLRNEPAGDSYLENPPAREPYLRLSSLLSLQGRAGEARSVLEGADWPPLSAAREEPV